MNGALPLVKAAIRMRQCAVSAYGDISTASRPEVDLLCHCARTQGGKQHAKQIKSLAKKDIEWSYVLRMALAHRVMPLVYRTLTFTCPDAVPKTILEQFRTHFYANAGRNLFLTKELIKLLDLLESHEIPAIAYKGPTFAVSIYGNLALRQFGDLDILVQERDYDRARHLLTSQGFRLTIEHEWESELIDESGTVAVDLHKRITTREFSCPLSFKYLSRRLQPTRIAGTVVPGLCPEDTLLMLSIQLTKDRHPQLAKICDMAEFLRVHGRLNWVKALKQAKILGGERIVLFGLCLTSNLLGVALPLEVARELRFHSSIHDLVNHASQQVFYPSDEAPPGQLTAQQFHWLLRERLRDKLYPHYLRYVHGVIVPCELDRRLLSLPRELSFLYYFIRPVRLIGKHGLLQIRRAMRRPRNHDLYGHDKKTPMPVGSETKGVTAETIRNNSS